MTDFTPSRFLTNGSCARRVFVSFHHDVDLIIPFDPYPMPGRFNRVSERNLLADKLSSLKASLEVELDWFNIINQSLKDTFASGAGKSLFASRLIKEALEKSTDGLIQHWIGNYSGLPSLLKPYTFPSDSGYTDISSWPAPVSRTECITTPDNYILDGASRYYAICRAFQHKPEAINIALTVVNIKKKVEKHIQELNRRIERIWSCSENIEHFVCHWIIDVRAQIRKVVRLLFKNIDDTDSDSFELNLSLPM